jgi:hypothetical protein
MVQQRTSQQDATEGSADQLKHMLNQQINSVMQLCVCHIHIGCLCGAGRWRRALASALSGRRNKNKTKQNQFGVPSRFVLGDHLINRFGLGVVIKSGTENESAQQKKRRS